MATRFDARSRPYAEASATLSIFGAEDGLVWVVAEEVSSSWWIWGEDERALARIVNETKKLAPPNDKLVADIPRAKDFLASL